MLLSVMVVFVALGVRSRAAIYRSGFAFVGNQD
jgi:hypothetical protein